MCDQCGNEPCTCQKALRTKEPRPWVVMPCQTPGCSTMIRVLPGTTDTPTLCKWCRSGTAYNTRPRSAVLPDGGPLMTKDEFGTDLYDAIIAKVQGNELRLKQILDKNTIAPLDLKRLLALS